MGRNAGSKIMFTLVSTSGGYNIMYYCQQHAQWSHKQHSGIGAADSELGDHFELLHGLTV